MAIAIRYNDYFFSLPGQIYPEEYRQYKAMLKSQPGLRLEPDDAKWSIVMRDRIKHVTWVFAVFVFLLLASYFWPDAEVLAAIILFCIAILLFYSFLEYRSLLDYNRDKNRFYKNFKLHLAKSESYHEFYQSFYINWVDETYNLKKHGIKNRYKDN